MLEELSRLGTLQCSFQTEDIPPLNQLDPDNAYGSWEIILNTTSELEHVKDVFIFVEDESSIDFKQLETDTAEPATDIRPQEAGPIAESSEDAIDFTVAEPNTEPGSLPEAQPVSKPRPEPEPVPAFRPDNAKHPAPPQDEKIPEMPPQATHAASASIRVDSARLDKLVNMVGEMVIIQSSLSQAASGPLDPTQISRIAEDLERLTDEMRENALGLRMLPIGTIYSNFKRLVHDLSNTLGKEVAFITEGAETELDKTVIDRLKDPLVHILRNCVDHGIEHPQEREDAGKARTGQIYLSSNHSGGDVVITIRDDGKGMDPEKIKEKALQLGLITAGKRAGSQRNFRIDTGAGLFHRQGGFRCLRARRGYGYRQTQHRRTARTHFH